MAQQVEVLWGKGKKGKYFLATVRGVNDDGSLNLLWDAKAKNGGALVSSVRPNDLVHDSTIPDRDATNHACPSSPARPAQCLSCVRPPR